MASSEVISTDKAIVIIQVNPQLAQDAVACHNGQETCGAYPNTALTEFVKAQPKALGVMYLMIHHNYELFGE